MKAVKVTGFFSSDDLPTTATTTPDSCGDGAMTDVIRVMRVDDHPIVRDGLRAMLMAQETMDVIGEAMDSTKTIKMARRLQPDVVVMDIGLPDINGLEATRQLRNDCAATRILTSP